MNLSKWDHPSVPMEILALKLCEEAGEVANALTDGYMKRPAKPKVDKAHLIEELDHVIDIAKILKDRC